MAAIVPIIDSKLFKVLEDSIDVIEAADALAEAKRKGTTPFEKIKKELGL